MAKRWTKKEDAVLARLYVADYPIGEIAARLRRSEAAVDARRRSLSIPRRSRPRLWSPAEDALVRAATAAGFPASALAARLCRSTEAVRQRRRGLGLSLPATRPYNSAEDEALRALWQEGGDLDQLAAASGRSADGLRLRARALSLSSPTPRRRWQPDEDRLLCEGYASGLTCAGISRRLLPDRSPGAIGARARKLGLATYGRVWSADEDRRLVELAGKLVPLEEAAAVLVRTPEAVRRRARKLGLRPPASAAAARPRRRWASGEDALLRRYQNLDPVSLARLLGRSDQAVGRRLVALGLRFDGERSPHYPVPASAELTPGERRLLARELTGASARRLLSLSRRLGRPPGELKRLAATGQAAGERSSWIRAAVGTRWKKTGII